jgi:hypothetical protein
MNKKVILFVVIIECIAAIMLVSFWGKIVESLNSYNVIREISFTDKDGNVYEDNEQVQIVFENGEISYQLYWVISPDDANSDEVEFITNREDDEVIVSEEGLVTFIVDTDVTITIRATDEGREEATITLYPKQQVSGIIDI